MKTIFYVLALLAVQEVAALNDVCSKPLGLEDMRIKDAQITAASSYNRFHEPSLARLNSEKAWCSQKNEANPWIKVKFETVHTITGVAIQGRYHPQYAGWYVKEFQVGYVPLDKPLVGGNQIRFLDQKFTGPQSKNDTRRVGINISTKEIFILATDYYPNNMVCLRMELYGCETNNNNPCDSQLDDCDRNTTTCVKTQTSFECKCKENHTPMKDSKTSCRAPTDYCKTNNTCSHVCVNELNGARCTCPLGLKLNSDNSTCTDIDECADGTDQCDKTTTKCSNTQGGYECNCLSGLTKLDNQKCRDINECASKNSCSQTCVNDFRGYHCECLSGFEMLPDNSTCRDIKECTLGLDNCDRNTTSCIETEGSFYCKCNQGLKFKIQNKTSCEDINECNQPGKGNCEHFCHNTYGSYYCSCKPGTKLFDDRRRCIDILECVDKSMNDCEQRCRDYYGGYSCDCDIGFTLNPDKKTCSDVDECKTSGICQHNCTNTHGSYKCSCRKGYQLSPTDKRTCVDYDECANNVDNCDQSNSECINMIGSYDCRCKAGFVKNSQGKCAARNCLPLQPLTNGYYEPAHCSKPNSITYKDVCNFKCMPGYQLREISARASTCNQDGNWEYIGNNKFAPLCEPIHCLPLTPKPNMQILPGSCVTKGAEYKQSCQASCYTGYRFSGIAVIKCKDTGEYDGTLNYTTCTKVEPIECPRDLTLVLPLDEKDTILPLEKLSKPLNESNLETTPPGVLTGNYRFVSQVQSHPVTVKKRDSDGRTSSCVFHIQVIDKQPPVVSECKENHYIQLDKPRDIVTWPEPVFKDNVGIARVLSSPSNGVMRGQDTIFAEYTASDISGNTAFCRFFVHISGKYCDSQDAVGGEGANINFIGQNFGSSLVAFVNCLNPNEMLSKEILYFGRFTCTNGDWEEIPDCVGFVEKTGDSCQSGYFTIKHPSIKTKLLCAKCPKGTQEVNGVCEKCDVSYFQDVTGSISCKKCPQGTTTTTKGKKSGQDCQAQCQPGTYSKNGLKGAASCSKCQNGTYQDEYGKTSCKSCPESALSNEGSALKSDCIIKARFFKIIPKDFRITARDGDDVAVTCEARGNPLPTVDIKYQAGKEEPPQAFRGQRIITSSYNRTTYTAEVKMIIKNVKKADSAVYNCTAQNDQRNFGGSDFREITITVQ